MGVCVCERERERERGGVVINVLYKRMGFLILEEYRINNGQKVEAQLKKKLKYDHHQLVHILHILDDII